MSLFTPQIQTQAAGQQVAQPVTEGGAAAAIQAFAPVTEDLIKTGIGFHQKGKLDKEVAAVHEELKGLDQKFSNINDAIASGKSRRNLQMRARAALNSAKANSPMLASYADQLYQNYFGGSSASGAKGTGSFDLTPAEKKASEMQGQISELTLLGWSEDQAVGYLQAKKQGEMAKVQADSLANQAKVNLYQVQPVTDAIFNEADVNFNFNLQTTLQNSGGTLSQESKINMTRDIDAWGAKERIRIQRMITDPKTGAYVIDPQEATKLMQRVETTVANQKKLLADNSYQKFLTDRKDILTNEAQVVAIEAYPELNVIRAAGGDQAASTWLNAKLSGNEKLAAWTAKTSPEMVAFMNGTPATKNRVSVKAASKLFGGTDRDVETGNTNLSPMEAALAGDMMSQNAMLAINILEKANNLSQVTQTYPAALSTTYSPKTQSMRTQKAATMKQNIQDMQNGAMNNFTSAFRSEFGHMPSGIQITVEKPDPKSILSSTRPYANMARVLEQSRIAVSATGGEQMSQEMVNIVADLYRSVKANPEALPDALRGLSPEEAVSIWINSGMDVGRIPAPMIETYKEAKDLSFSYRTPEPKQPKSEGTERITEQAKAATGNGGTPEGKPSEEQRPDAPEMTPEELKAFNEWAKRGVTAEDIRGVMENATYNAPAVKGDKGGERKMPLLPSAQIAKRYQQYLDSI